MPATEPVWPGSIAMPRSLSVKNGEAASPFRSGFLHRTLPASRVAFRIKSNYLNRIWPDPDGNCERRGLWRGGLGSVRLGLLPKRLHLLQASSGCVPASGGQSGFDEFEAADEFGIGGPKRYFGIDLEVPGEVGDHEEKVADLFGLLGLVLAGIHDFASFLGDLVDHFASIIPVESNGCRAALKLFRTQQCGQGDGNVIQQAGLGLGFALLGLDVFP